MWRVRNLLAVAAALGVGVVLSACGGDSSPETLITVPTQSTTETGLSKAEFIAQADATCAEANAAIEQFAAAGQGESEADQIAQLRQGIIDKLNELGPPAEDKTTLDQFIAAMQAQVAAGQKIALAVERGEDTAEFDAELQSAKADGETAASTYGFQECGSQISSSGTSTSSTPAPSGGTVTPSAPSAPSTEVPDTGSAGGTSGGATDGGGTGGDTGGGPSGGPSGGIGPG